MVGLSNIMLRALTENHLLFHNIYFSFFVLLKLLVLLKLPSDFRHQRVNTQSETKDLCSGLVICVTRRHMVTYPTISDFYSHWEEIWLKIVQRINPWSKKSSMQPSTKILGVRTPLVHKIGANSKTEWVKFPPLKIQERSNNKKRVAKSEIVKRRIKHRLAILTN